MTDPIQAIFAQRNAQQKAVEAWREQIKPIIANALDQFATHEAAVREAADGDEEVSPLVLDLILKAMRTTMLTGLINMLQINVVAGQPADAVERSLYPMQRMFAIIQEEVPTS